MNQKKSDDMLTTFRAKYKIQSKIGEGSFSEVLKCQDRHNGMLIAAKQLKKTFRNSAQASELPELLAMRKLTKHPNILHMIESHFDSVTGKVTLVFELMDMSLYDLMKNRKRCFPESKAKWIIFQVVKGVDHIHHHGIFHRDIKPENILVKGEAVKISDLGSIKGSFARHPFTEYISTRWYRSPETLLTSGRYGPKMDVWAVGCVFFELLTLKPLFPGSSELDQIFRINQTLGLPGQRLLAKLRRQGGCLRNSNWELAEGGAGAGRGVSALLPPGSLSPLGREALAAMLAYDPDARINARRLAAHKYFSDLRELDSLKIPPPQSAQPRTWRNPLLLSYLATEKKKRQKVSVNTVVGGGGGWKTKLAGPRRCIQPSQTALRC